MGRVVAVVSEVKAQESPDDVAAALDALRAHAAVDVERVAGDDHLRAVLDGEPERLVVLGGDGSVHRLVQVMHDRRRAGTERDAAVAVALLPLGTGNDLARGVGVPLDVPAAARLAVRGAARPMAVLLDDEEQVVVNAAHVGVGAAAARTAEEAASTKSVLGGAAYSAAAVVAGLRTRGWHLRVRVDGREVHDGGQRLLMVAVGLGRTIGGGAPVAPNADPFSGRAQVTVSRSTGWAARLAYAAALRHGRHHVRQDVTGVEAHDTVEVSAVGDDAFSVDADGELSDPVAQRTWRVVPEAWSIVAP
ncbi:diacylglycerol/lipid kinase family protein [Aquipuribacter sp. SD81]|uniref:diacylglycerol/lipid kinase family protein n=1 Tax=Aquipuribacter sp. SD81 TaxID=3127703 RepID=UPI003018849E